MKNPLTRCFRGLALTSVFVLGGGSALTFGQSQDPTSCNPYGQIHGVFYMRCFDRLPGENTDTQRIRRAISQAVALGSGKLVFDWGWTYIVDAPIDLPSFIMIEGINKNTTLNNGGSTIVLKLGSPGPIFRIGPGKIDITIRNIALKAQSRTGTTGIRAANAVNDNSSTLHVQLSNLRFSNFAKGIHVTDVSSDSQEWQFDDARLVSSTFESCEVGVELNSSNTQWLMSNVYFTNVPAAEGSGGSYGIKVLKSGSLSLNFVQAGGPNSLQLAGTFIYIAEHGVVSIQNSQSERFYRALEINRSELAQNIAPISLMGNSFSESVVLKNATVFSHSNQYGLTNVVASGNTRITSLGDKFCIAPPIDCEGGKIQLQDNAKVAMAVVDSIHSFETTLGTDLKVENGTVDNTKPLISGITNYNNGKPLLELGVSFPGPATYKYSFRRDVTNGWLAIDASQGDPYRGFMFNGPVALPTYTRATIPIGIAPNGSMLYCSDCRPNTTPCADRGTGALVVMVNYIWTCK